MDKEPTKDNMIEELRSQYISSAGKVNKLIKVLSDKYKVPARDINDLLHLMDEYNELGIILRGFTVSKRLDAIDEKRNCTVSSK